MYTKPLHVIAYVDPAITAQNPALAAKSISNYPLAVVMQRNLAVDTAWRDSIKSYNPSIRLLGYLEATTRPLSGIGGGGGPGFNVLALLGDTSCVVSGHSYVTGPGGVKYYDPRLPAYRDAYLSAIDATLRGYPFAGVFIDNLTVFVIMHPDRLVRDEMLEAKRTLQLEARAAFPTALMVGNSSYAFRGLNGEMAENRTGSWPIELPGHVGLTLPRMNLAQFTVPGGTTDEIIKKYMDVSHSFGASFGYAKDYQHIETPACFSDSASGS